MASPTFESKMEDALTVALNENSELKERLRKLEARQQEIVDEKELNVAKAAELQELVDIKCQSDLEASLLQKSLRNAELSFQVDKLHMKLQEERANILKMAQERETKKRMLLELSDIVRTLQSVAICYSMEEKEVASTRPEDMALGNIKRKIAAIMQDRSKLIEQCNGLKAENTSKDQKIAALEAHFHVINSIQTETSSTASELTEKQPRTIETAASSTSSRDAGDYASESDQSTVTSAFTVDDSEMTNPVHMDSHKRQEELVSLKNQLSVAQQKYDDLKDESQKVLKIVANINTKLKKTSAEKSAALQKRETYRKNLQDVIAQYKELQAQHEDSRSEMQTLKSELNIFRLEKDLLQKEKEQLGLEAQQWKPAHIDDIRMNVDDLCDAYEDATGHIRLLERQITLLVQEAGVLKKQKANQATSLRDAIFKHRTLERDFEVLEKEMEDTRMKIELAKKEEQKHKEQAKHARRRLTGTTQQVKKLQDELEVALEGLLTAKATQQKVNAKTGWSDDVQHKMILVEVRATAAAWANKKSLCVEQRRLMKEHEDMRKCSEDILRELDSGDKSQETVDVQVKQFQKMLAAKECDLRDCINRYKRLEKKYSTLVTKVKSARQGFDTTAANSINNDSGNRALAVPSPHHQSSLTMVVASA